MTNKMVTLTDAKVHLSKLTDLAAQGETVIITKHGKPVARVLQDYAALGGRLSLISTTLPTACAALISVSS